MVQAFVSVALALVARVFGYKGIATRPESGLLLP
jgi:hypothetical protein